jgi:hypothetical protein
VVGTNYQINGRLESGSSISAALYAAFLANAIEAGNFNLVKTQTDAYTESVRIPIIP